MNIDKGYKMRRSSLKIPARRTPQDILVIKLHAFATNGRVLTAVPVQSDGEDTVGWMTPDALKFERKCSAGDDVLID